MIIKICLLLWSFVSAGQVVEKPCECDKYIDSEPILGKQAEFYVAPVYYSGNNSPFIKFVEVEVPKYDPVTVNINTNLKNSK
jgi:hypothetical protein